MWSEVSTKPVQRVKTGPEPADGDWREEETWPRAKQGKSRGEVTQIQIQAVPNVSRVLCRKLHKLLSYRMETNPPKTLLPLMHCLDDPLRLVSLCC